MEFGLSEEQLLMRDALTRYLVEACPVVRLREVAAGNRALTSQLKSGLSELGLSQVVVPADYGGLGLGVLDACVIQMALGHAAAPVPFLARSVLAVQALNASDNAELKERWLPSVGTGEANFSIAINELGGSRENAGVTAQNGRLTGKSLFVLELEGASHVIVAARGATLHVVDLHDATITTTPLTTIDKTRLTHELVFEETPAVELCSAADGGVTAHQLLRTARVLLSADTIGAADEMLRQAVEYAGQRQQFGRIIASFQAVKHMCSEMAARLEPCRSLAWYAAHAIDVESDDAALMALLTKSHVAEMGQFVARTATEVHGGMGFTEDLGLHLWFKRIGANRQLLGGPNHIREEAAKLQGWA